MRDEAKYKKTYRLTQVGRAKSTLTQVRLRALKKPGMEFDLDEEWLLVKIASGRCEQSGIPFDFSSGLGHNRSPWTMSLDRIDSRKGYTKENTQVVVWAYNAAKSIGTDDDVYFLARCLLGVIPAIDRGQVNVLPLTNRHRTCPPSNRRKKAVAL